MTVLFFRKAEPGLQMVSEDEMYKDHNVAKARHVLALGIFFSHFIKINTKKYRLFSLAF